MPRRSRELIQAAARAAEARRAVAGQRLLVETLKATRKPSRDAEDVLQMCISALELLEGHERRLLEERRSKAREARKAKPRSEFPDHWQFGTSQPDA
jgi:hypothetical protein